MRRRASAAGTYALALLPDWFVFQTHQDGTRVRGADTAAWLASHAAFRTQMRNAGVVHSYDEISAERARRREMR